MPRGTLDSCLDSLVTRHADIDSPTWLPEMGVTQKKAALTRSFAA